MNNTENQLKLFQKLMSTIKFKIDNNFSYFIVKNDFNTENYNIKSGGMLLPTIINGNRNDGAFLSILYKIKLNYSNNIDEGLVFMTYENIATLVISNRLVMFYVDNNSEDTEIKDILNEINKDKEV